MVKVRSLGLFLFFVLFLAGLYSQEGNPPGIDTVPESLRRPQRGEAPRYPRDTVLGELGRGTAPEDAWRFAQAALTALVQGDKDAPVLAQSETLVLERLLTGLEPIGPEKYRLGGGRVEADGAVSFLVRFLGSGQSMSGELYLIRGDTAEHTRGWLLDDLVLEEAQDLAELREAYRFDFSPYERFY